MSQYSLKLPDIGEGIAEAELVEWLVAVGDIIREDDPIAAVMTDKANVEIPTSKSGRVISLGAQTGDMVAVGSELILLEIDQDEEKVAPTEIEKAPIQKTPPKVAAEKPALNEKISSATRGLDAAKTLENARFKTDYAKNHTVVKDPVVTQHEFYGAGPLRAEGEKPLASPSVRLRAREAGLDLRRIQGSGPAGRIMNEDLDVYFENLDTGGTSRSGRKYAVANFGIREIKVTGLRRKIAERMQEAKRHIPHITIIEEVDVTQLEDLRAGLNTEYKDSRARLTLLPFVLRAAVKAVERQPLFNAHFDDEAEIIRQFGDVHTGIATQTPNGLVVSVIRNAQQRDLWELGTELTRLSQAARDGNITREELTGSTITVTSLGPLGAVATTPIINRPEVAIIGINKIAIRPIWENGQFVPRKMMNLSCSFDHRIIDGWDAAVFVQQLKKTLENPAMLFV